MKNSALVFLLLLMLAGSLQADRRYFTRSYLANTLPAKALEFELWNTIRAGKETGFYYRFQPRMEFEYGITDRLSASMYLNFDERRAADNSYATEPLSLSSTALEMRYRLTDPGTLPVDPALYFEYSYGGNEIEYEGKLLLSRRDNNWITALNINTEIERKVTESKHETKFEITGGAAYELNAAFALGAEIRYQSVFEEMYEEKEGSAFFAGPCINWQTEKFYLSFSFLAQLSGDPVTKNGLSFKEHERYEVRSILGIAL